MFPSRNDISAAASREKGGAMLSALVVRAILGAAGLAFCLFCLVGEGRAEPSPVIIVSSGPARAPDLFGTVALPVRAERFYDGWERARRDASGSPRMAALVAQARNLPRDQQIAFVQGAVHRLIRWRSDATEWGHHDYWASAAETLARGAGDMEDRAIVKMQALKSLGVPARDLYMTMGRDKVGGPVTVLIVRSGGRYLVLDDTGGAPFATDRRPDFEPMITLGHGGSWLHGRRTAPARTASTAAVTVAGR
jgi:predicted transglutaminase-like cysteine proteinase